MYHSFGSTIMVFSAELLGAMCVLYLRGDLPDTSFFAYCKINLTVLQAMLLPKKLDFIVAYIRNTTVLKTQVLIL